MSLFNTLATGASGMGASSTSLSVIGDNIANLGTTGFKSSMATFADTMPNLMNGLGGPAQLGTGTALNGVALDFGQGQLQSTSNAIDVAILGQGFFQVASGSEMYYSRDGGFHLDADNNIVNSAGLRLQGFQAVNGTLTSTVGDLTVDPAGAPQKATETITGTVITRIFRMIQSSAPMSPRPSSHWCSGSTAFNSNSFMQPPPLRERHPAARSRRGPIQSRPNPQRRGRRPPPAGWRDRHRCRPWPSALPAAAGVRHLPC